MIDTIYVIDYLRACIRVREERRRLRFWNWLTILAIIALITACAILNICGGK
jgi:hypothetical protein